MGVSVAVAAANVEEWMRGGRGGDQAGVSVAVAAANVEERAADGNLKRGRGKTRPFFLSKKTRPLVSCTRQIDSSLPRFPRKLPLLDSRDCHPSNSFTSWSSSTNSFWPPNSGHRSAWPEKTRPGLAAFVSLVTHVLLHKIWSWGSTP